MEQKGYQRIELIPLLALIRDHNGDSTVYVYDGNSNLVSKTDADGYVTQYSYTALDLVKKINYNGAKEVSYQYNKVGELVQMDDWTGTNTFELDLLGRLQKMTDHKGNTVSYIYDAVGNQTGITYPDGSKTRSFYDAVYNLTSVIDADDGTYAYVYDAANRPVKLTYPNGWIEQYTYDAEGNLLKTVDTDPFQLYNKTPKVKYEYTYDAEGNVLTEFQRDSDATENLKSRTAFTYDALNRLTGSTRRLEVYPYDTLAYTYTYDTLGNLLKQSGPTKGEEDTYQYNDLNQMVSKHVCGYEQKLTRIYDYGYTYDKRGNLVKEEEICSPTTTGPKNITIATYLYDETNRMVRGTNKAGEVSAYTFNGLGVRVGTELILEDNSHGYTDFHCQTPSVETGIEKPEVVKTDYVIDYTRLNIDQRVLMKSEQDGYDFFYTYGLDKLQVMTIGEGSNWWGQSIKKCVNMAYVHTDRLGSVVNLSDEHGRVTARADYTDWGEVRRYTDITVDGGFRRLLPEITYATHEYDDVLNQFYAKARMYDAENKRFDAVDLIAGTVADPISLVQYLYAVDNPIKWIDPLGEMPKERLNLVNVAYLGGAIDKDQVFAAVSLLNVLDIATSGVRDLLGNISASGVGKLNGVIDSLYRDTEEDLFESDGITDQSIYLSFHETAQVLASKQIHLASSKKGWPILEARHLAKEIDIKLGHSVWEVKPGYSGLYRFDSSLKKYIDTNQYTRYKRAENYKFKWYDVNKNVPGFAFTSSTASMLEINGIKYSMLVSYLGPGKVGYFFKIQCGDSEPSFEHATAVLPAVEDIYETAREVNAMSTKAVIAVGVFVGTLLSPVLGDEVAGAGALSNAWAAVKSIGLSQSALAVFQGLTMQFGYVLP